MHLALSPCLHARAAVTSKVGRKALAALAVREAAASDTHTHHLRHEMSCCIVAYPFLHYLLSNMLYNTPVLTDAYMHTPVRLSTANVDSQVLYITMVPVWQTDRLAIYQLIQVAQLSLLPPAW